MKEIETPFFANQNINEKKMKTENWNLNWKQEMWKRNNIVLFDELLLLLLFIEDLVCFPLYSFLA